MGKVEKAISLAIYWRKRQEEADIAGSEQRAIKFYASEILAQVMLVRLKSGAEPFSTIPPEYVKRLGLHEILEQLERGLRGEPMDDILSWDEFADGQRGCPGFGISSLKLLGSMFNEDGSVKPEFEEIPCHPVSYDPHPAKVNQKPHKSFFSSIMKNLRRRPITVVFRKGRSKRIILSSVTRPISELWVRTAEAPVHTIKTRRPFTAPQDGEPRCKNFDARLFTIRSDTNISSANAWFLELQDSHCRLQILRKDKYKRIRIAILDTGINISRTKFRKGLSDSKNEVDIDIDGHGTTCVALLQRVAPWADIYVARVTKSKNETLEAKNVMKALERACNIGTNPDGKENWGVDIVTMSFGFLSWKKEIEHIIEKASSRQHNLDARERPVLFFAAAGNNGTRKEVAFPASMSQVFAVNSATGDGNKSSFNPPQQINSINFSILGESVPAVTPDETEHEFMSGTSAATPIAAGLAALILEFFMQDHDNITLNWLRGYLWKHDAMQNVFFREMSTERDGYQNLVPWKLSSYRNGPEEIIGHITSALDKYRASSMYDACSLYEEKGGSS
ncbi:hypothetical protein NHQ30_011634 [Ciborinia camelliae]|nr:hypothetical protein NHQ30_011634 [Ciborinia camelliae]